VKELQEKEYQAVSVEQKILSTKDKMSQEKDEVNIIIWNDYLRELNYQLNSTNCDIYLLRQKIKNSENEKKFPN
jgi:hypothetical protein